MNYLLIAAGLTLLLAGGHWLVSGADALARHLRLPAFLIGLLVLGFGTSLPELMVSVLAALDGTGGIAIGNVVGSNIANILLILGLSALAAPLAVAPLAVRTDVIWMTAAALLCLPLFWNGALGRVEAAVLLAALALYLGLSIRGAARNEPADPPAVTRIRAGVTALIGLAALLIGARMLVTGGTALARDLGVSEAVIGLTIVAIGTSLPELATSVTAAIRGQRDMAVGNVVGSNVFNVLAILGITGMIAPIPVAPRFVSVDAPVMIAVTLVLAALLMTTGRLGRIAGASMLAAYAAYLTLGAVLG